MSSAPHSTMELTSHEKAAQRREAFRGAAPGIRDTAGLPGEPFTPGRALPEWAVWTADGRRLVVLVAGGEPQHHVDRALAYGLAHLGQRRQLVLVLPDGTAEPTLVRAAHLNADIQVWSHDGERATRDDPMRPEAAQATLFEAGGLRHRPYDLGDRADWVADLTAWASRDPRLSPAHRKSYLSWHSFGMQVLQIRRTRSGLTVTAGIHYTATDKKPTPLHLHGPLSDADLKNTTRQVKAGIDEAKDREAGPYKEHLLQDNLSRHRRSIGWADDLCTLREFPALRPGGGTGYLDFIRITPNGQTHIVETKVGPDPFLVLQGLDYWIWTRANQDLLEQGFGNGITAATVDFILGAEQTSGKRKPLLSWYALQHLDYLPAGMRWRFHHVPIGPVVRFRLTSLDERSAPDTSWTKTVTLPGADRA